VYVSHTPPTSSPLEFAILLELVINMIAKRSGDSPSGSSLSRAPCAVEGILKGYDALLNLVLDDCLEFLPGAASTRGNQV
jgi:hypothetical protein